MSLRQWVAIVLAGGTAAAFLAAYGGLVRDGSLPPPDFEALARMVGIGTTTAVSMGLIVGVAAIGLLAMLAPIIYAIRAQDILTVVISLALTGGAITLLFMSRTVLDMISALILYLANITLSAVVYLAHRVAPNK